ncbi:MAG: exosortase/archaeosortase family protein [Verrucomicrobiota bacterium]|nr:exosortase/archaeosortase family protein [Verrucomicrobiota bacterium]
MNARLCRAVESAPFVAVLGLLVLLFGFMGNSHDPGTYGPSILTWTVRQWNDPGGEAMHGWLIPLVSLFFLWRKRREIMRACGDMDARALAVVVVSLFLYWAGCRAQQPRLGMLAFIGLAWSIPWHLFGYGMARQVLFPCVYLVFAIPMGFLVPFTFPLRLLSCVVSAGLLNGFGVAVHRVGTAILDARNQAFALNVDDPCSGINSLIALGALTAAYGYATQKTATRAWLLFLSAAPIAVAGNVARIVTIAVVAKTLGTEAAMRVYHDFSGLIVFPLATLATAALGEWLRRIAPRKKSPA